MTAREKIKLSPTTLPSFLPGFDTKNFVSTMSDEEGWRIIEERGRLLDEGKEEEAEALAATIPVDPTAALTTLVLVGKENLLSMGSNLADAEKAYGSDWLDRFDVGGGVLDFAKD